MPTKTTSSLPQITSETFFSTMDALSHEVAKVTDGGKHPEAGILLTFMLAEAHWLILCSANEDWDWLMENYLQFRHIIQVEAHKNLRNLGLLRYLKSKKH